MRLSDVEIAVVVRCRVEVWAEQEIGNVSEYGLPELAQDVLGGNGDRI